MSAMMTVEAFSKYVIDNLKRASLVNALNIPSKFSGDDGYNFLDFVKLSVSYINSLIGSGRYSDIVLYKLLVILDDGYKLYSSNLNYNKQMILDDTVINMWEAINKE